jgi:hypothetical protein
MQLNSFFPTVETRFGCHVGMGDLSNACQPFTDTTEAAESAKGPHNCIVCDIAGLAQAGSSCATTLLA